MQKSNQLVNLPVVENAVKRRHVATANQDRVVDMLICRRHSAGKLLLEPKDDIKKRGLRSTDVADALALNFAMPVMPRYQHDPVAGGP